jgi:predicted Zn-dependent peptidase
MRSFDGAFSAMDRFRTMHLNGLNYEYYENLKEELKRIEPSDILDITAKYFTWDSMKKIMVGKLN